MANILVIDDQAWVIDLCREGLAGEGHMVLATDDIESVGKNVLAFKPNLVLLNQYLKHGFLAYDVLWDIKMQDTDLPVLIVTAMTTSICPVSAFLKLMGFCSKVLLLPMNSGRKCPCY